MRDWEKIDFSLDLRDFAGNVHNMLDAIKLGYSDTAGLHAKFAVNDWHRIERKWMRVSGGREERGRVF